MRTKLVSMAVLACASLASAVYLLEQGAPFPWMNWLLMLFATLAVDMGTTGFNTYFDFVKGVDRKETNHEEMKVLVHEGVSPSQAFLSSIVLFAIAVILGLAITIRTGWAVAASGSICMLVGFFYSAGPKPISHTPFGELFSGGFLGSALFCISWFVLTDDFSVKPFLFSVPLWLMISGILTVNNNCDLESDKAAGRRTMSIVFGLKGGRILLFCEYIAAIALLLIMQYGMQIYPKGIPLVTLSLIILLIVEFIFLERRGFSLLVKGPAMGSILNIFLTGAVLVAYPLAVNLLT
ncbi:MAG: prenyltransferase [Spirochaetales bacterium]|uniref:Prenyltransferase n=1 Tax=Candidatus Thalassospirochaeta sargassi TaxID=3119039 RepID=A0AAJ1IHY1_9SPIO|nr:prenyltransferase [Spirochaetales bacterium]